MNNDDYSFDQNYDDDVYDDGVSDYDDNNMMASSPGPSMIHDAQALTRSFTSIHLETSMDHDNEQRSSISSLNNDNDIELDIDNMDEDTVDVIYNNDISEVSSLIDETQLSVHTTTNEREPIVCSVPPIKEFDEQLKWSVELYQIIQEKNITDDAYAQILKFVNDCLISKELGKKIKWDHSYYV